MSRNRLWFWISLFVFATGLLATLAASWNVVLVLHYREMLARARDMTGPGLPWVGVVLGTLGFVAALSATVLFFVRLLKEMKLNALQRDFLARVSHELKTPIATIEVTSSFIRSRLRDWPEGERLWELHDRELKRLRREVEALLEAARLESGPRKPETRPVRLESWLSEALPRWRQTLGEDGKIVRKGVPLEIDALVDPRILDLIADNIVDNARKFARGVPKITVRTELAPRAWTIRFKDEGWGFEPKNAGRIFGRFVRVKTGAPHAIPGTGVGLYVARQAARSMKLRLRGESDGPGKGASFTIEGRHG